MGNNEHSLDRIERNAAAEADLTNSQAELAAELETAAETPAPLPRRMGRLSEAHVKTIEAALFSQLIQFEKLATGGTEATDEYFTTRLAEVEAAYDAVVHFGIGGW